MIFFASPEGGGSLILFDIIHFVRPKLMSPQNVTSLACLEPANKFSVVVVLKATLVFSFGPNWNFVLGLGPS